MEFIRVLFRSRRRHACRDEQIGAALFHHQAQKFLEFHRRTRNRGKRRMRRRPVVIRRLEVLWLLGLFLGAVSRDQPFGEQPLEARVEGLHAQRAAFLSSRSEEQTSELQSLMRISYAVFCFKKKKKHIST